MNPKYTFICIGCGRAGEPELWEYAWHNGVLNMKVRYCKRCRQNGIAPPAWQFKGAGGSTIRRVSASDAMREQAAKEKLG